MSAAETIVADIGGTNARFARLDAAGRICDVQVLATGDFSGLVAAVGRYVEIVGGPPPRRIVAALAGPITGDIVALTNGGWQFSRTAVRREMALERLAVLNDFHALALSLPHLGTPDMVQIGGPHAAAPGETLPKAVIGPGTGLGMCGLIHAGGAWIPIPGEGGYTSLAPGTDRETAVWQFVRQRHGRVSAERLLSGPGLTEIRQALAAIDGGGLSQDTPETIVRQALGGQDPVAWETLSIFCALLGDRSGDLALTFGALGGVYLAGGILKGLGEFLRNSDFRDRFEGKGRGNAVVSHVPTYLITAEHPALIGCASLLGADNLN